MEVYPRGGLAIEPAWGRGDYRQCTPCLCATLRAHSPFLLRMYLQSLKLTHIKLLADQEFSFKRADGSPRLWTVLVGDNGLCKSTLLQTIALAASGPTLGTALARDTQSYRRAASNDDARIEARFSTPDPKKGAFWPGGMPLLFKEPYLDVALEVRRRRHDLFADPRSDARLMDEIRAYRTPGWLTVGYGVGRFLPRPGEVAIPTNHVSDRVEGLFDVRHKMLGTDFYGALKEKKQAGRYSAVLRDTLLAADDGGRQLLPMLNNVELRGKGGVQRLSSLLEEKRFAVSVNGKVMKLPVTSLSDGYQSTISWIADLLGHVFLDGGANMEPSAMSGIVLLDEIDLHLHPTWQRRIVPILKRVFPKLQFIVTTHSPLVLTGFEKDEIIRLRLVNGLVEQTPGEIEPGIQSASEILTDYFDVPRAGRPELVEKERRYLELKGMDRLPAPRRRELMTLEEELRPYWEGTEWDEGATDDSD